MIAPCLPPIYDNVIYLKLIFHENVHQYHSPLISLLLESNSSSKASLMPKAPPFLGVTTCFASSAGSNSRVFHLNCMVRSCSCVALNGQSPCKKPCMLVIRKCVTVIFHLQLVLLYQTKISFRSTNSIFLFSFNIIVYHIIFNRSLLAQNI